MCGILGIVALQNKITKTSCIKKMLDAISHRGPDDAGYLFLRHDENNNSTQTPFFYEITERKFSGVNPDLPTIEDQSKELSSHAWDVILGHRRLSILDLSRLGHQPMSDVACQIWLSLNGEIYNYRELREELKTKGYKFKSNTDTEVIIYAYLEWGIKCVHQFNGMFAFALYDNRHKNFYLARDRYGIKPLYYTENSGNLVFASEIKAIKQYSNIEKQLDLEALFEYFTFQNIFTNKTFDKDIKILEAGHYIQINLLDKTLSKVKYWDFDFSEPDVISDELEYQVELDRLFRVAVSRQVVADVPVGAYLSGGVDSGAIAALTSKQVPDLKTFTVGFDLTHASGIELAFDERANAEYMSYCFKTEQYEMVLKSGDMERCLPKFVYHLEEPRVGQSYPNYYAAKLASKFVKVVMAGTGGDELFGGYPWRYFVPQDNNSDFFTGYYKYWQRLVPNVLIKELFAPIWSEVKGIWTLDIFKEVLANKNYDYTKPEDCLHASMYFEAKTFLHGLLVVEDKLSMAHSLETRVPFLDNDLVDFAQKLPAKMKVTNTNFMHKIAENDVIMKKTAMEQRRHDGKYLLRKLMKSYLPANIVNNAKQGFSSPDGSWFKGESIELVKKIIYDDNALIYNYLSKNVVRKLVDEHLSGTQNRRLFIWSLLNFEGVLNAI